MATHSSIFAPKLLLTEKPDGLQFMGLQSPDMIEHAQTTLFPDERNMETIAMIVTYADSWTIPLTRQNRTCRHLAHHLP